MTPLLGNGGYWDISLEELNGKILIVWITLQIAKNSHFHSPTPEDVEESMYVCQAKRLEMFPLTFQKLRFDERPASSRVLRRHAEKANVFIQNWPFALN